jgi:calcineurin-like phosphoesterase family protein
MRTAIVSDLHLGSAFGEDILRDADIRRALLKEIAGAERLVLLGDVVELREGPLGAALAAARPFFEDLGDALGEGVPIVLIPGNHDHRFAEPLLDQLSLSGELTLGLEQRGDPTLGPTGLIDHWLGGASLEIAYPGLWLREDVYATHGHYMDCHLSLPRAECLAAAALMRASGPLPNPASPEDYERALRPLYGFAFGFAQSRASRAARQAGRTSEAAWELVSGNGEGGIEQTVKRAAARAGVVAAVWTANRLLGSRFDPDLSSEAIFRSGVAGATEMARRLGLGGVHLITGHTHRGGPRGGEPDWQLPGGGQLHNTGSWVFASAFHHPGAPPGPYWPGTVTWVEGEGSPYRVELLGEHSRAGLAGTVAALSQATAR